MKYLFGSLIFILFAYLIWAHSERTPPPHSLASFISTVQEINQSDTLYRNVVGIQPYMEVSDYFSQIFFQEKIKLYLSSAKEKGFLKDSTIVLLPEYLGTWLVLESEKYTIAKKNTLTEALTTMVLSNPYRFLTTYFKSGDETDKAASTLFRMKSKTMAESYQKTFSKLAQEFNTYIVAGSIILPEPTVYEGKIISNPKGKLFNASFVFDPEGNIIGEPILKAFLIDSESPFLTAGTIQKIPVLNLPFAKTSILICADSWYPDAYQNAIRQDAELILVPSYCTGNGTMATIWKGYNGNKAPKETDPNDVLQLTEEAAWVKYALPGQIKKTKAQVGMNVFLRGNLWDLGADGQPFVLFDQKLMPITHADSAGIWSLNY